MTWFFIASLAPALWALTNHIDKYLTSRFFANQQRGTGSLLIFTGSTGLLAAFLILIFIPSIWQITFNHCLVVIFAGMLLVYSYIPYLYAMQNGEASTISTLYQTIPVFLYVLAFFTLGEVLDANQLIGSLLVIAAAVTITLETHGGKIKLRKRELFLMLLSSFLTSLSLLLFKLIAITENFWVTSFWEYLGWALAGLSLFLFLPQYRREFLRIVKVSKSQVFLLNIASELSNIVAKTIMNYAGLLAPLALVWVINGLQPFFVFIFAVIITCFLPWLGREKFSPAIVLQKLTAMAVMVLGLYLIGR